jgi:hypothetical protein
LFYLYEANRRAEIGKEITWGELHVGALSVYEDAGLAHGQQAVLAAGRHADRV